MANRNLQTWYYFYDYKGLRHSATSRKEAESLRMQLGGGYVVYEITRNAQTEAQPHSGSNFTGIIDGSFSEYMPYPNEPTDGRIYFFLSDYGRIGIRAKTPKRIAYMLWMLLMQRPFENLAQGNHETSSFEVSLKPISGEDVLIYIIGSLDTGKLLWSFSELLDTGCIYRDSWDIERSHPFKEWESWASGSDPTHHEVSLEEEKRIRLTREPELQNVSLWAFSDDDIPWESHEDTAWARECELPDEELIISDSQPSREDEDLHRDLLQEYHDECLGYYPEQDRDECCEESPDEYLVFTDYDDDVRMVAPSGYDGFVEEYWSAIGQDADPANHWE